jgi:hypothetical protein
MIATFRARLLIVLSGQKGQVVELSTNAWSAIVVIAGSMTGPVTLTVRGHPLSGADHLGRMPGEAMAGT